MSEHRVYTRTHQAGSPQVGDIVVIDQDWTPDGTPGARPIACELDYSGCAARLEYRGADNPHGRWCVTIPGRVEDRWVYAVRWPTPAELAAYQLGAGGSP